MVPRPEPLPDLCPGDGRPHWDHEPRIRVRHLGVGDDAASVELVAGCCPGCGQVLVNLELQTEEAGQLIHDEACWVSLDDIRRETHGFVAEVESHLQEHACPRTGTG